MFSPRDWPRCRIPDLGLRPAAPRSSRPADLLRTLIDEATCCLIRKPELRGSGSRTPLRARRGAGSSACRNRKRLFRGAGIEPPIRGARTSPQTPPRILRSHKGFRLNRFRPELRNPSRPTGGRADSRRVGETHRKPCHGEDGRFSLTRPIRRPRSAPNHSIFL